MKRKFMLLTCLCCVSMLTACGASDVSKEQLYNTVDTIYDATGNIENVTDGLQDKIDEQSNLFDND